MDSTDAFTPGPWQSERDLPHNRMPRVHGGDHSLICEVGNMGTDQDQWEANAALIAAAPDLYEALDEARAAIQAAMAQIDAEERDHMRIAAKHEQVVRAWSEKRRAALAKARGETHD